jgi:hypothetical protein
VVVDGLLRALIVLVVAVAARGAVDAIMRALHETSRVRWCGAVRVRVRVRVRARRAVSSTSRFYPHATARHSFTRDRFRSHARPATRTHVGTWFTHAHAFTMSSMSAHMTSRAATQKVMMTKGRKATNARATRAVTRAGRFEAERTYIMIKCV